MTEPSAEKPEDDKTSPGPFQIGFAVIFSLAVVAVGAYVFHSQHAKANPDKVVEAVELRASSSAKTPTRPSRPREPLPVVAGWPPPAKNRLPTAGPTEAREVERVHTPLTEIQLAEVLIESHKMVFGGEPNDQRLSCAWGHLALEHLRGQEIDNHNLGNMILGETGTGDFFVRVLSERTRKNALARLGKWENVEMRFRSHANHIEGGVAYWKLIRDQYTQALAYFDQGNGYLAARKLAEGGYMTAEPGPYATSMGSLQQEFLTRVLVEMNNR